MRRGRRNNVVRGRFSGRGRGGGPTNLPPELTALLKLNRNRRTWRRYLALWGAAALAGTAYGAGWLDSLWPREPLSAAVPTVAGETVTVAADAGGGGPVATTTTTTTTTTTDAAPSEPVAVLDAGPGEQDADAVAPNGVRASFSLCHTGGGFNCVVDGDTIWLEGQNIRVADIDAPETHEPRCPSEKELGDRATLRLQALVNSGAVTVQPIDRDEDNYGRKLRLVLVDGQSVGDTLVSEGLVRWYAGGRRSWC